MGHGGLRGGGGGGYSGIKDEIASMERIEHNTTIRHNVMNKDGIK